MTQRKYTNRRYLDALEKKVLVFDGAMGTRRDATQSLAQGVEALRVDCASRFQPTFMN